MLLLRAHHGICMANFVGHGYDEDFVRNMTKIRDELAARPETLVQLICREDILCSRCPHNVGVCDSAAKSESFDRMALAACGLRENVSIRWDEYSRLVEERILMTPKFGEICKACQWYDFCLEVRAHISSPAEQSPIIN